MKHGIALILLGSVLIGAGVGWLDRLLAWPAGVIGGSLLLLGMLYLVRLGGIASERWVAGFPGCLLILPYTLAAGLSLMLYRLVSSEPRSDEIAPRLRLGSAPLLSKPEGDAVLNVCAEFGGLAHGRAYHRVPMFDGLPPLPAALEEAVSWAAEQHASGKTVLVHCAQGHGRSAAVMAAVLVRLGLENVDGAFERIRKARPGARPSRAQIEAVTAAARRSP